MSNNGVAPATDARGLVREALWRCLQTIVDPEGGLAALSDLSATIPVAEDEFEGALAELLADDPLIAVLAARLLMDLVEERKDWRSVRLLKQCQEYLNHTLRSAERETRMWACLMLQYKTPGCVVEALQELQNVADRDLRVFAAAALVETEGCDSTTLSILREALTGDNEVLVAAAATALARLGAWNDAAIALLTEALRKRSPLRPMPLLEGLKHVGAAGRKAAPAVAPLIFDKSLTLVERRLAAVALGSITQGTDDGVAVLEQALDSADWQIVAGAAQGLALSGRVTASAVARLVTLTSATEPNVRRTAYEGLRGFGEQAAAAVPALITRIGEEPDSAMLDEVIRGVVAMGIAAVAPLVELLRGGDVRKVPAAEVALTAIAGKYPAEVLEVLLCDRHPQMRAWAAKIVAELGSYAAPALPRLSRMLAEATDDERASDIMIVIAGCGPVDETAAAAVVGALSRWREIPEVFAEQWLPYMGPNVPLACDKALQAAAGDAKKRLQILARSISQVEINEFQEFAGINLLLIETYCCVGELLRTRGPTSWPMLLKLLQENPPPEPLIPLKLDIDPRTLSARVKELAEALGMVLTDESQRRRGGLTEDGLRILDRCKAYSQALKARRIAERREG